jgi:hypothetical protein
MTTTAEANKTRLTNHISKVAGVTVEITTRGPRAFTYSFDGVNSAAANRIVGYFGSLAKMEIVADDECGTFVYCDLV